MTPADRVDALEALLREASPLLRDEVRMKALGAPRRKEMYELRQRIDTALGGEEVSRGHE